MTTLDSSLLFGPPCMRLGCQAQAQGV